MLKYKIKNPKKTISLKALDGFITGISRIISKFDIDINSLTEMLKIETVLLTHKKSEKIIETAIKTGIDRRVVSEIVKNNYKSKKIKTENYEIRILQRIRESSKLSKNNVIPKYGDLNCLKSILKRAGCSHIRMNTFIEILEKRGAIKDLGDSIKYLGFNYKNKQDDEEFFSNISRSINRYSETVLFNKKVLNNNDERGRFEKTIFTTQVHPDQHAQLEEILFYECREFHKRIVQKLEHFETAPPDTYDLIGVSTYQVKITRGTNNDN